MIPRRRFLAICAAALALPARADTVRWQGRAMGAEVSLTIEAPRETAHAALREVRHILRETEQLFSLYDPDSSLSQLNASGRLDHPDPRFVTLLTLCNEAHHLTQGRFDPTVQRLWQALAQGQDPRAAQQSIGWHRITIESTKITLAPGQALTLNGIAQGFATDLVRNALNRAGLARVLVNIGEYHGSGREWHIGVADPQHGLVARQILKNRALATSSPGVMPLGRTGTHILDPKGDSPRWSTVSVEAKTATMADALSTAFCHASDNEITDCLRTAPGQPKALCISPSGTLHRFTA